MKKIFAFTLLFLSLNSFGANHIISAGTSGSVLLTGEVQKDTVIDLNLGYHYALSNYFQLGVHTESAYIYRKNTGGSTWYAFIAPSFILSVPWGEKSNVRNSFYVELSPGIILTDPVITTSKKFNVDGTSIMGNLEIGNRFSLTDDISYTPGIGVYMYKARIETGRMVVDPYLTFLKFDLFF